MNPFFIVNQATEIPEILIYGYIGEDEVNAGDFIKALRSLEATSPVIVVRINSGGGSIFEGIAMYNAMKNSKAVIKTRIDGIAASMGSILALGGTECLISKHARIMTHKASGISVGSATSMRSTADLMESLEGTLATIYAAKTGLTADKAKEKFLSAGDKWMTAEEALTEKLVDGIFDAEAVIDIPVTAKSEKELWQVYNTIYSTQTTDNMKQLFLTAEQLGKLNLKADTPQAEVSTALDAVFAKAAQADDFKNKLEAAEQKLIDQAKTSKQKEVTGMLDVALNVDKKITKELHDKLAADYSENPDGLKTLLAAMPKFQSITDKLKDEDKTSELEQLKGQTYEQLDKAGKLERLKALSVEDFKAKFKAKFGTDYKG